MDIQRLEEFVVLSQSESMVQAAEALGISASLLSSRIGSLESKLGLRLLERDAHRIALTEAGQGFLPDARQICADYRRLTNRLESTGHHTYRSLKIAMAGFVIPAKLGPYLDTVNLKHPDIHLEIMDDRRYGIRDGLNSNAADLYFSYCPDGLEFEGIEKELVYTTKAQVLVPQGHRLANKSSISIRELDGERFVLYPLTAEPAMHNCELALLQKSGINFSVYEESVCPSAYFVMVPVGKGLVICPWLLRQMIPPTTVALTVDEPYFVMNMYMFYRSGNGNPYLPRFLEGFRSFSMGGQEQ